MRVALLIVADVSDETEGPLGVSVLGPSVSLVGHVLSSGVSAGSVPLDQADPDGDKVTFQTKVTSDDIAIAMSLVPVDPQKQTV